MAAPMNFANELSTFFPQNSSTPLYMAAELGYMGLVKALLKVGADVNKAVGTDGSALRARRRHAYYYYM